MTAVLPLRSMGVLPWLSERTFAPQGRSHSNANFTTTDETASPVANTRLISGIRMLKDVSLSTVKAFESAARHGSFRAAACELNLSPSAISHAILKLEQSLGTSLFEREGRSIRLSPDGETLMQPRRARLRRIPARHGARVEPWRPAAPTSRGAELRGAMADAAARTVPDFPSRGRGAPRRQHGLRAFRQR